MTQGFLLIDGNNLGFAAQHTTPLRVGDQPTQAIYGVLRAVRMTIAGFPSLTPIVLWDGATWRKDAFPEYKANREKEAKTPHEIAQAKGRAEYKTQKKYIARGLALCGVRQMWADNLEADDLVGIMVRRYQPAGKKVMMISGDKDWIQLVRPGVGWMDPMRDTRITLKTLPEKLGYMKTRKVKQPDGSVIEEDVEWRAVPSPEAWLEIKALQGDDSDNIGGVGGIAFKGAVDLIREYGTVANFLNRMIDKSEMPKVPKKFLDFAESDEKQGLFRRNMMLMDLSHPSIPKPVNLRVKHAPLNRDAFEQFCGDFAFASFLKDLDGWLSPFTSINPDLLKAA